MLRDFGSKLAPKVAKRVCLKDDGRAFASLMTAPLLTYPSLAAPAAARYRAGRQTGLSLFCFFFCLFPSHLVTPGAILPVAVDSWGESAVAVSCRGGPLLRLRGGVRKPPKGRAGSGQREGGRGGGNAAHLESIDIKDFKEDVGEGRKLSRDRKRDGALQEWMRDDPFNKPTERQHPTHSSLHPMNRMAALMRMEKMKKKIERRGKGTRRRLAIAKRDALREQRVRSRAAKSGAENRDEDEDDEENELEEKLEVEEESQEEEDEGTMESVGLETKATGRGGERGGKDQPETIQMPQGKAIFESVTWWDHPQVRNRLHICISK